MLKHALCVGVLLLTANVALADGESPVVTADKVNWGPAPPVFPKGAQVGVLAGDPFKGGTFVLRLKMPDGYKLAAHNHPTTEYVTVISGKFHVGMGDDFDAKNTHEMSAGAFVVAPAKMSHYAFTTGETIVQVQGEGPFAMTYVNPSDDPSKQ
jgi:quercetin dioxygenase-like cupin family protein